ncbi:hypothetical protein VTK56DRAFT_5586 [Thermocarpiscus australiensis]
MRLPSGPSLQSLKMATQLAHLPEVERLSAACVRILGGNPGKFTLQGTNTYLLGTGPKRLLIDTGEGKPSWIAALKRVLEQEKASIDSAIITHWHHDHTGGIPQLREAWPDIKVYKHQPAEPEQLDIADGQAFRVEGASLRAAHTPGHTADHVVLVWEEEDAMFTGDNVLGQGTAVFEDLGTYMASLEVMKRLFRGRAYPGHGPVLPDGPGTVAEYIRHRQQREAQVLQTLRCDRSRDRNQRQGLGVGGAVTDGQGDDDDDDDDDDAWTVMELVRSIYRDVPESLHPAAAGGVAQILRKLQREGRVVVVGGERWRLSGRSAL